MVKLSIILIISISFLRDDSVEACSCSKHQWKPFLQRTSFLDKLSNSRKLNTLSLIGTHSSFSYLINEKLSQTQDFDVQRQLKYGIRVLDIGICPQSGSFEIYAGPTSITFDDVLTEINRFLDHHPWELIIILLRQTHVLDEMASNNCNILSWYFNQENGRRLVTKWQLNDTIGVHRGKILLASLDNTFHNCAFPIIDNCLVNNNENLNLERIAKIGSLEKWISMFEFSKIMARKTSKCYVNDVSFAYEGDLDRRILARDAGYQRYSDNSCAEPINQKVIDLFKKQDSALLILIADFVVQELIDKVNDGNFIDPSWRSSWE